jgi:hypothetical protein
VLGVLFAASPHQPEIAPAVRPSTTVALAALGVAILLALGIWEITGHLITMAHEGAHALALMITGKRVRSVTIQGDLSGVTTPMNPEDVSLLAYLAGYAGPPLFGLLGAALLVHGSASAVLWICLLLLGLLLVVLRNVFGFVMVFLAGAFFYLTVTYASAAAQTTVASTLVWILLVGGVISAFEQFALPDSDYRKLQHYSGVIPWFVSASFGVLVAVGCLVLVGASLPGHATP